MAASEQKHFGKIAGGMLGLFLGGPLGAALGLVIGHAYDRQEDNLWDRAEEFSAFAEQRSFTVGVIVLSAKMARSDGRVKRAEIDAFKRVFDIKPSQEAAVGFVFDRARVSAHGFEPYAKKLAHVFRAKPQVLEAILGNLFIIGAADSEGLSAAEIAFLKKVSFLFGFGDDDFARIAARAGVHLPGAQSPRAAPECFVILGVSETTADSEIKAAYRSLIQKHHPDRLIAQGMPPEFIASATEKMKRINAAYDEVCKIRGIS